MIMTKTTTRKYHDAFLPSPQEIAEACEKIQTNWTEEERHRRTGGVCDPALATDDFASRTTSNDVMLFSKDRTD